MKRFYKYFPSSDIGVTFSVSLLISVFIFFILLVVTNGNLKLSFTLGIITFLLGFFGLLISNYLGRAKHRKILHSTIFKKLRNKLNLEIETLNENKYHGLKGTYKKYFIRIYYDWFTRLPNRYVFREVCVMIYFNPLLNSNNELDINFLNRLNEIYFKRGIFKPQFHRITVEASYIKIQRAYTIFTTINDIVKKIEKGIEIALKEKLEPIKEGEVNKLMDKDKFLHGPDIVTFQDY